MAVVFSLLIQFQGAGNKQLCAVTVHDSQIAARQALASWCRSQWEDTDQDIPDNNDELIGAYFEASPQERYTIEKQSVRNAHESSYAYEPASYSLTEADQVINAKLEARGVYRNQSSSPTEWTHEDLAICRRLRMARQAPNSYWNSFNL